MIDWNFGTRLIFDYCIALLYFPLLFVPRRIKGGRPLRLVPALAGGAANLVVCVVLAFVFECIRGDLITKPVLVANEDMMRAAGPHFFFAAYIPFLALCSIWHAAVARLTVGVWRAPLRRALILSALLLVPPCVLYGRSEYYSHKYAAAMLAVTDGSDYTTPGDIRMLKVLGMNGNNADVYITGCFNEQDTGKRKCIGCSAIYAYNTVTKKWEHNQCYWVTNGMRDDELPWPFY